MKKIMTKQRRLVLLALLLLLISVGTVMAQSSAGFIVHRTALLSGGSSSSASYRVQSVIGQQSVGIVEDVRYQGTVGYLFPLSQDATLFLPMMAR